MTYVFSKTSWEILRISANLWKFSRRVFQRNIFIMVINRSIEYAIFIGKSSTWVRFLLQPLLLLRWSQLTSYYRNDSDITETIQTNKLTRSSTFYCLSINFFGIIYFLWRILMEEHSSLVMLDILSTMSARIISVVYISYDFMRAVDYSYLWSEEAYKAAIDYWKNFFLRYVNCQNFPYDFYADRSCPVLHNGNNAMRPRTLKRIFINNVKLFSYWINQSRT